MGKKKKLVLSGINLYEGGPLSIYLDLLNVIHQLKLDEKYHIVAFVHNKNLFRQTKCCVEYIELPKSRKSYLHRFYYEYVYFYKYSKKTDVHIWLSLHDITPNVVARKRMVYCHNPSPFLKADKMVFKYSKQVFLMSLLYKYIYKINIKKNDCIIVQQDWIRKEFKKMYGVENVIVARPTNKEQLDKQIYDLSNCSKKGDAFNFIYAAYPRVFKNFEVILKATKILEEKNVKDFQVLLTIDGTENIYTKNLRNEYGELKQIKWLGLVSREELFELYKNTDCMIFPSKLETWGLPISEYKQTGNPVLLADLPYAHETVGTYNHVAYFNPYHAEELASKMREIVDGTIELTNTVETEKEMYFSSWEELLDYIL